MNSNEAEVACWGAPSNTNERADWDPHLNPIKGSHCSGQVGCFCPQAGFSGRAGVCRVVIMHSLLPPWFTLTRTAFLCGPTHLHTGDYLPHNNVSLFHSVSCLFVLIFAVKKGFLELKLLKRNTTNWSFSYSYFWSRPELQRKIGPQLLGWSVGKQGFLDTLTVVTFWPLPRRC